MRIAFFTENKFHGQVVDNHLNMRLDMAWINLLEANNIYMYDFSDALSFDIGIVIIPKNRVDIPIEKIKKCCKRVAIMQEGPCDYWTDYTLYDQTQYLRLLLTADFLLVHNTSDISYFAGLTGKNCYVMPSVMVESLVDAHIKRIPKPSNQPSAIIGGNMCQWYNGMVSFIIAKGYNPDNVVYAPSMGRKITGEERIHGLKHLPYMTWLDWMQSLNNFDLGVHMMPTVAAGTFSLNCAYLGIPCIGNQKVDTQAQCHPNLSIDVNDISAANELVKLLKNDPEFYKKQSEIAITEYENKFHSRIFIKNMIDLFKKELA